MTTTLTKRLARAGALTALAALAVASIPTTDAHAAVTATSTPAVSVASSTLYVPVRVTTNRKGRDGRYQASIWTRSGVLLGYGSSGVSRTFTVYAKASIRTLDPSLTGGRVSLIVRDEADGSRRSTTITIKRRSRVLPDYVGGTPVGAITRGQVQHYNGRAWVGSRYVRVLFQRYDEGARTWRTIGATTTDYNGYYQVGGVAPFGENRFRVVRPVGSTTLAAVSGVKIAFAGNYPGEGC